MKETQLIHEILTAPTQPHGLLPTSSTYIYSPFPALSCHSRTSYFSSTSSVPLILYSLLLQTYHPTLHTLLLQFLSWAEMEKINSKLYMENCYIMAENERLRKKAEVLNKENQALLKELKKKNCRLASGSSHPSPPTAKPQQLPDLNNIATASPNSPNN